MHHGPTWIAGAHLGDRSFSARDSLGHGAHVLVGHIAPPRLLRLLEPAVHRARHDLRSADLQFEALSAHRLDEHGKLQLTAR